MPHGWRYTLELKEYLRTEAGTNVPCGVRSQIKKSRIYKEMAALSFSTVHKTAQSKRNMVLEAVLCL
jgi:hypothetical protein